MSLSPHHDNPRLGIGLMLIAVALFSVLYGLVKGLSETYPLTEVTFFRNLFALIPVTAMIMANGGPSLLHTRRLSSHVWRSAIGLSSMVLGFLSYHLMPLADAVAISFAAPLFLTALAVPLLREHVGIYRWSAVAIGFCGVLVIVRPSGDMLNAGALAAVGAAMTYAFAMIAIRQLSRTEAPLTIVFYFTLISTLLTGLTLPFAWTTPTAKHWVMLLAMGLSGGVAQYFMTRAFAVAPAAVVSPFNYFGLLWATLFGWIFWGDIPRPHVFAGAAVVVASGLFILYRETRQATQGTSNPARRARRPLRT